MRNIATLAALLLNAAVSAQTQLPGPLPLDPTDPAQAAIIEQVAPLFPVTAVDLRVTPGHRIVGCVQLPLEPSTRGGYHNAPWPLGIIYYSFHSNVTTQNQTRAIDAMTEIESFTSVDFRLRTSSLINDYIQFTDSSGNNAPIGYFPGAHVVNIVDWGVHYTIVHELFHVLGIIHEQARTDRDSYVLIQTGNISQTACGGPCNHNFNIDTQSQSYGYYNFASMMHYSRNAFSIGGDTIVVRPPYAAYWQSRIGQRDYLSEMDAITAQILYQPADTKWLDISRPPGNGSFAAPYNNFPAAWAGTPANGEIIAEPGTYPAVGIFNRAVVIHAPNGTVTLR